MPVEKTAEGSLKSMMSKKIPTGIRWHCMQCWEYNDEGLNPEKCQNCDSAKPKDDDRIQTTGATPAAAFGAASGSKFRSVEKLKDKVVKFFLKSNLIDFLLILILIFRLKIWMRIKRKARKNRRKRTANVNVPGGAIRVTLKMRLIASNATPVYPTNRER